MSQQLFVYDEALTAANQVVDAIAKYCHRIEICGGLRRSKPEVHDIDIVAWARDDLDRWFINVNLGLVCDSTVPTPEKTVFNCRGIPGEIYFVTSEQQYEVMKLIRTGDYGFTRSIATNAIDKGYMLKFSVDPGYYKIPMYGLYKISGYEWKEDKAGGRHHKHPYAQDMRHPIAYKERDILWLLYGKWIEPSERNWGGGGEGENSYETGEAGERQDISLPEHRQTDGT